MGNSKFGYMGTVTFFSLKQIIFGFCYATLALLYIPVPFPQGWARIQETLDQTEYFEKPQLHTTL